MSQKNVRWLYGQLPELVDKQVVTADTAERIKQHYQSSESKDGSKSVALIVCGVVGALLIGMGIILLLAHNWEHLSRPMRTVISFLPLVLAQILVGWTVMNRQQSVAWRESTSTFLMAAIGSSIALIGQTYNIPGDMKSFLQIWMLLTIPVVYLLQASVPAVFYLIGTVCWAGYARMEAGHALGYWLLVLVVVPHILLAHRKKPEGFRSILLFWALCITVGIGMGFALQYRGSQHWILAFMSLFAVYYLLSGRVFSESLPALVNPFFVIGTVGIAVVSLMLTYRYPWRSIFVEFAGHSRSYQPWMTPYSYAIGSALLVASLCLLAQVLTLRIVKKIPFGLAGMLGALGIALMWAANDVKVPMLLFNLYLFVLGIHTIRVALVERNIGKVNLGLLILAALIIARFFDSGLSFTLRGIAFIFIGIGFLVTNILIKRRMATS